MNGAWLQFIASGLTVGAIYALVALGFSIIYNASGAINFAQGEFVMIGGMSAVTLLAAGLPLALAAILAIVVAVLVALLVEKLAIEPARDADTVTLIIITIGVSLFLRGLAACPADGFVREGLHFERPSWHQVCLLYTSPSPRD